MINEEKGNVNYSEKMLIKYYQLLNKFNKKLEKKDVLLPITPSNNKKKESGNRFDKSSTNERKIIYIKENEKINSSNSKNKRNYKLSLN